MKLTTFGKFLAVAVAIAIGCAASNGTAATILASWTFETSIPATAGPHAAEVGSGSASGLHAAASTYSSPAGPASLHSFSSNAWAIGDYYQFSTSSTGSEDIKVSFDATGSNTGPKDFKLAYSTDNSTYTDFGTYALVNAAWSSSGSFVNPPTAHFDFDLSSIAALDNQSAIYFRLIDTSTTAINSANPVAATGTSRVDNFTVTGIPEPATIALASLAGLAFVGVARRRS